MPRVDPSIQKLEALAELLSSRADDTTAKKEISQATFVSLARSLQIPISISSLGELLEKAPLNAVLEPLEPNSGVIRFKGNPDQPGKMSVNKAQDIVGNNAKKAMRRGMNK